MKDTIMYNRLPDYFQLDKYNISPEDIVKLYLKCDSNNIRAGVIVTPLWKQDIFGKYISSFRTIAENVLYEMEYCGHPITLLRTGVGAPLTGDFILALGCTPCEKVIFTGSVGGLIPSMEVGDLIIPDKSLCGDGFSRYLSEDVKMRDCFLCPSEPDEKLTDIIKSQVKELCQDEAITIHYGTVFSSDSIIAEFFRLDYFTNELNCIGIEMETAAVFKASKLVDIKASAILEVSDVTVIGKNLFSGRTKEDAQRRHTVRETVMAKAILDSIVEQTSRFV